MEENQIFILATSAIILLNSIYWIFCLYSPLPESPTKLQVDSSIVFSIILPMRNESKNVERKLAEVIQEILPDDSVNIIVIDSASSDGTGKMAEDFLSSSILEWDRWRVITSKNAGKSRAINAGISSSDATHFIMMDADSIVEPGWLGIFQSVFSDSAIGSVSGIEMTPSKDGWRGHYRTNSNRIRLMESMLGTTTVLEGGLIAWKSEITTSMPLLEYSNGDDSQLALNSIRLGHRSIVFERLKFLDSSTGDQMRRSIRRSQGLSRNLFRNWDLIFLAKGLQSRIAVFFSIMTYLIFPWCYSICILSTLHYWYFAYSKEIVFLAPSIIIALSLLTHRGRSVLVGSILSIISHFQFLIGKRYDEWVPSRG